MNSVYTYFAEAFADHMHQKLRGKDKHMSINPVKADRICRNIQELIYYSQSHEQKLHKKHNVNASCLFWNSNTE